MTSGTLGGIDARTYALKRYKDGTFELSARADSSKVRFSYSASSARYYTIFTAVLPDELTLADDKWICTGSVASSGIYLFSPNNIQGKTLSFYLSADADPGEVDYMNVGFVLKGQWV